MYEPRHIDEPGDWWFASEPGRIHKGTLTVRPDAGPRLQLLVDQAIPTLSTTPIPDRTVHGRSAYHSTEYTLFGCTEMSRRSAFPGPGERVLSPSFVLKGFHLPSLDEPLIRSVTTSFKYVNRWASRSGMSAKHHKTASDLDIRYRTPRRRSFDVKDGLRLVVFFYPKHTVQMTHGSANPLDPDGEFSVQEKIRFALVPDVPHEFQYFGDAIRILQDYMTIASRRLALAEDTELELTAEHPASTSDRKIYHTAELIHTTVYRESDESTPVPSDFLFREADAGKTLKWSLRKWFASAEATRSARTLYVAANYSNSFLESRFLLLCQAIESYHRSAHGGGYMAKDDYSRSIYPILERALPGDLSRDHLDSLKSRLRYGYEYSLRTRLKSLVDEHEGVLKLCSAKAAAAVDRLIDARNGIVHDTPAQPKSYSDWSKVIWYCEFLSVLLELCFLSHMGFDQATIHELVKRNLSYRRRLQRAGQPE
ncbi:MAG: hypothetical protein JXA57_20810 [Armatimonadetes bacterium]|nr:hypothetical protein [Armatimonadota bacterium]